jgi:hypothetical protein
MRITIRQRLAADDGMTLVEGMPASGVDGRRSVTRSTEEVAA